MSQPVRISYVIMAVLLVLIAWLHLGTLVLTSLFGYFALQLFSLGRHKFLGLAIYIIRGRDDWHRTGLFFPTGLCRIAGNSGHHDSGGGGVCREKGSGVAVYRL